MSIDYFKESINEFLKIEGVTEEKTSMGKPSFSDDESLVAFLGQTVQATVLDVSQDFYYNSAVNAYKQGIMVDFMLYKIPKNKKDDAKEIFEKNSKIKVQLYVPSVII